ncbi:unnamed protein product, partial [Tenebrio molitor]
WPGPSRPHASPPEEKPPGNNWLPKRRGKALPPLAASRSPTVTDLVPWLCVRSVVTRKVPSCSSASFLSTFGEGDRSGFQNRFALPKLRRDGPPGSERSLLGRSVRGHEFVRHPRQTCNHHAKGHPTCQTYSG